MDHILTSWGQRFLRRWIFSCRLLLALNRATVPNRGTVIQIVMITYTTSKTKEDLEQILALQKQNLAAGLTIEQITSQGFVTVSHSFQDLHKMNEVEAHVIARDN